MVDDLNMTLKLAAFPNITEIVVSRNVILELLALPDVSNVRLNIVQESHRYRFLHSLRVRGKLFINPSERRIIQREIPSTASFAGC